MPPAQQASIHAAPHTFGKIQGTYSIPGGPLIDAGIPFLFKGSGQVDFLGAVNLSGTLQGTGDIARGQANGELTLSNERGSVTLYLVGPDQGMFAPMPQAFHFSTVNATGAYKGLRITGSVDLVQHTRNETFTLTVDSLQVHDKANLAGNGSGDFTVGALVPDAGTIYRLTGSASVGLLGRVTVSGTVQSTGFILIGRAMGELTLNNSQGSVTLQLTGPVQPGFSPLPKVFHFSVVSATGSYKGLKVAGSIEITLDPILWLHPQNDVVHPWPGPWEGGGFHLTIQPNAN
jgi:hypothetical protein